MGKKWVDEGITTRANRTPEQRERDARANEGQQPRHRHEELWAENTKLLARIAEIAANATGQANVDADLHVAITKLEARLDELHDLVEQQQDGARHLAGRIDRIEARIKHLGEGGDIRTQWMGTVNAQLDELDAFKARVIAAYPLAGKPTMQEQCDAVEFRGPTEEDEG